jgi:cellulose synthase/poly-beta-1,6-N-acetylglucosamine synthase-like glycosyltransferase
VYPLILTLYKKIIVKIDLKYTPYVTLLIVAHNEEKQIEDKIINSLELDYPKDRMQILVVSDGSTDKTNKIVKNYSNIDLFEISHSGKTIAQNEGIKISRGEIIVFSDANSMYEKSAIRRLVVNFTDPRVGCACGELRYKNNKSKENLYWSYEVIIKLLEGNCGRLLGANGSIYAIRKSSYVPLEKDAISDFLEPILIYGQNKKIVYTPKAIAYEDEPISIFNRKRRIILRSLVSLKYAMEQFNPFKKNNLFFNLVSHKILRWAMPILLIGVFISNIFLINSGAFYSIFFILQLCFYLSGMFLKPVRYFIIVHCAAIMAIIDWILGKRIIKWSVLRQ